jgi:hypothetical protein
MMPSDQQPKLPLWIFLATDAVLMFTAWFIATSSARPLSASVILTIAACVIFGALIATVPLIAYYERVKNETLDDRQRALETLATTVASSAQQISIAANGLHEITELANRNVKSAEQLPQKLQEKIASFKAQLDSANADDREELEKEVATLRAGEGDRLESAADKIAKAIAELTKLESSAQKHLAASTEALTKATAALAALQADVALPKPSRKPRAEEPAPESPAIPDPNPQSEIRNPQLLEPAPIPATAIPEIVAVVPDSANPISGTAPLPAEEARPARKRAPRKSKPEVPGESSLPLEAEAPAAEHPPAASDASPGEESVPSPDGITRLNVTAYIGIGNRLFIRGHGPGLNPDKGVPLQFVSIGKWRWESFEVTGPVQFKLYKNDDTECAALGSRTIDPGQQQEVTATF